MTWEVIGIILTEHGIYVFAIAVLGWAYWQERKYNRDSDQADKAESREMITALVEVKDALRQFEEMIRDRFPKR